MIPQKCKTCIHFGNWSAGYGNCFNEEINDYFIEDDLFINKTIDENFGCIFHNKDE